MISPAQIIFPFKLRQSKSNNSCTFKDILTYLPKLSKISDSKQISKGRNSSSYKTYLPKSSNISGSRKFSKDHNSDRLFCSGVPVSNNLCVFLYCFSSLSTMKQQFNTWPLLSCQSRVTVTSCFVYNVIRDLESIYHVFINPICRIGLINKRPFNSRYLKWSVHNSVILSNCKQNICHCHFWLALQ